MRLILPNTFPNLSRHNHLPLFFIGGPILGGDDWQAKMCCLIRDEIGPCIIVNPCPYPDSHPLYRFRMVGNENHFQRQLNWERYFLREAADRWPSGSVIFWCPEESKIHPRNDRNPYARDTYGEIAEWRGRIIERRSHYRVAVGGEEGFPGFDVMRRNFEAELPDFRMGNSMREVVELARPFTARRAA